MQRKSSKIGSLVLATALVGSLLAIGATGVQAGAAGTGTPDGGSKAGRPLRGHRMHANLAKALRQAEAAPARRAPKAPASRGPAHLRTEPSAAAAETGARKAAKKDDPLVAFDGLGSEEWGDAYWPSLSIDVGPEHVVQVVNASVGVFDKTGTLLGAQFLDEFFAAAGTGDACQPSDTEQLSEPQVIYDSMHDRWIVGINSSAAEFGPYWYCLAVSAGGDPVDADWRVVSTQIMAGGGPDKPYPYSSQLGIWADGIYLAADRYCDGDEISCGPGWDSSFAFSGPQVWAFNLDDLESGAEVRNQTYGGTGVLGASNPLNPDEASALIPVTARMQSGLPPEGRNAYFVAVSPNVWRMNVYRWAVDWTTPANSRFTGAGSSQEDEEVCASDLEANPPNYGNCSFFPEGSEYEVPDDYVPVLAGNPLDSGWDYVMPRVVYTSNGGVESLWLTNGASEEDEPFRMGIKYYEIQVNENETSLEMNQATNFWTGPENDDLWRWMPSLAVDKDRNVGIVYTTSSENDLPSVRFAGYSPTFGSDYLGAIGEGILAQSTGYQCCVFEEDEMENTSWGPNGSASLDPDGCTIWGSHEYLTAQPETIDENEWRTVIGAFRFPGCEPSLLATSVNDVSGFGSTVSGTATLTATLKAVDTDSPLAGRTVTFELSDDEVGTAETDASGVATLTDVDISELDQGSYPGAVGASFAATGPYEASANTGTLTVVGEAQPQTIDFPDMGNHAYGDPDFDPGATASSELEVTYTAEPSTICTIVGNKVHIQNFKVKNGVGTCTVTAHQDGNEFYDPAAPVSKSFQAYTQAKIALKYVQPKKNVTWGGNVKITVKVTAPKRKPSGLVTIYVAPKGSDEWTEAGTVNYAAGKKKVAKAITAPCGPAKGKYQVQVTFTDNVGSQQTVSGKKPKPFQLKKSGVC